MDVRQFHRRVFDAARALIPHRAGVVCAVSGGADSVAMLHVLVRVNEIHECGWRLAVAHLDHQLRPESADDAAFVRKLAEALKLPCMTEAVDVRGLAKQSDVSIETAARNARYEFLRRAAYSHSASGVCVGHHADDQAETVLHRILRGTGLTGLAGMPSQRPLDDDGDIRLVRPMLTIWKHEIIEYCKASGLACRDDVTNHDPDVATRNRIRNVLLPLIHREFNPQAAAALVHLARQADRASEFIRAEVIAALDKHGRRVDPATWSLQARPLSVLSAVLRTELVVVVLERLGAAMQSIGFERLEAAAGLFDGDGRARCIELAGGVVIERRGAALIVRVQSPSESLPSPKNQQVPSACR